MTLLITGVALWIILHLFPSLMVNARASIISNMGEKPYKAVFAVIMVGALMMIIFGWRSALPTIIYNPPVALRVPAMILVTIAFILLVGSHFKRTRIKRYIRHPMLTAIAIWAFAHLLANGDSKSLVLFAGFLLWSILSMILINRRDGEYQKPTEYMPVWREFIGPVAAIIIAGQVVKYHYYIAGVPLMSAG